MKRLLALLLLLATGCQRAETGFRVADLKVNYEVAPMTVETGRPQFSWRMASEDGHGRQTAYVLEVLSEAGRLLWSSGKINSAQSQGIEYAGEPIEPTSRYQWKVKVFDDNDRWAEESSWFETGFMRGDEQVWSGARWIGGSATDVVFRSDYLSVFSTSFDVQIDVSSGSQNAAFLLGGNDPRLMNGNLNLLHAENPGDGSFVAIELDISGFATGSNQARLNVYRVGYTTTDSQDKPLFSLPVPATIIDARNRFEAHRIKVDVEFGAFNIYISKPPGQHQRETPAPYRIARGLVVSPVGAGGDYVAYPVLGDVGFWLRNGQKARFSNIELRHLRSPSNILFAAGSESAGAYQEIFLDAIDGETVGGSIRALENSGYEVASAGGEFVYLANPSRDGAPMLRREFHLDDKAISKATLYVTARGIYEVRVNGSRVGKDYFAPGLTQYNRHHTYQAYDVASHLKRGGGNAIGALLAEGWWSGNSTFTGDHWNFFGDRQSLLAKLVVSYTDGTEMEVLSEPGTWKVYHGGPIRYGSFFQGEIYDARRESLVDGWATAGFDDSSWQPAQEVPLAGSVFTADSADTAGGQVPAAFKEMQLVGHPGNSPQIVQTLQAVSAKETRPGVFVYDMGQNMVGVPGIQLEGAKAGSPILLRFAEMLYPDLPAYEGLEGTMMIENLRAALVHDIYYPKGGREVIQPRFTFHGFRYVEISGLDEPLPLAAVQGLVISSVTELTAGYETSNPLVNKLWENITWSMRGNFLSIPTDTPARNERLGWSGDINVFASTANYMAHVNPFIRRHMMAMRDTQSEEGRFPDVAPLGVGFGGPLWGSAGILVPWQTYLQYGDVSLLREHYPAMVRYIEYLQRDIDRQTGLLSEGLLGDWLSPESRKNDKSLLWEAYHVHALDVMAKVANLLGKPDDARRFARLHGQRKAFFNRTYVDSATGRTVSSGMYSDSVWTPPSFDPERRGALVDSQASYAIPIALDVFDETNLARAKQHLVETVVRQNMDDMGIARPAHSLMTGFIGTASLPGALSKAGRDDLAYRLLQQTSYPSWLYSVVNGATTIWERLDSYTADNGFGGNNHMNSFNHYSFGAVGSWMMEHSLGIRRGETGHGFQSFVLAPVPDPTGQMSWAKGYYDSLYGRIESRWSLEDDGISYQFSVPENTAATLYLPANAEALVTAGSDAIFVRQDKDRRVYRLEPGIYKFIVRQPG